MMENIYVFCQPNTFLDDSKCCYGALRATLEISNYLKRTNRYNVLLFAEGVSKNNFFGIPCRAESSYAQMREISDFRTKAVIGISRGDCFRNGDFNVVYHHGPHKVLGLDQTYYDKIDRLICVSKFSKAQQIDYGINPTKIRIVSNAIDPQFFYPQSISRIPKSYLYAGQIRGYKGIANLLEAFVLALLRDSDLKLDVCGENLTWSDGDQGCDWLIKNNWLTNDERIDWEKVNESIPQIRYLGEKSQQELVLQYSRHAYLVCPSVIPETFGLVSLEAQACGCIPIIANHGGYLETLVKGCPRFLFEPWSPNSLADEITKSSKNNYSLSTRNKISSIARSLSWEASGKKFLKELNPKGNSLKLVLSDLTGEIIKRVFPRLEGKRQGF